MKVAMRRFLDVLAGAIATALVAVPAQAQIIPCSGVNEPGFKVLLDDIAASDGKASPIMQPLIHRIDANLEQLEVEAGPAFKVLRCEKRKPNSPADFKKALVQQLTDSKVMLEVWGTTSQVTDGGEQVHEASIGYALMPVRLREFDSPNTPGAFLVGRRAKSVALLMSLPSSRCLGSTTIEPQVARAGAYGLS